jgi:hypothetical protein
MLSSCSAGADEMAAGAAAVVTAVALGNSAAAARSSTACWRRCGELAATLLQQRSGAAAACRPLRATAGACAARDGVVAPRVATLALLGASIVLATRCADGICVSRGRNEHGTEGAVAMVMMIKTHKQVSRSLSSLMLTPWCP